MTNRKVQRAAATRRALLSVARDLFAERGFALTTTEEIVRRASVTRGALYHHFRDKRDLFRAVFEALQQEVCDAVVAAASSQSEPWMRIVAGNAAFLDACTRRDVQRIGLLDAPAVLGWETWREIEGRYGAALVRGVLELAMAAGVLERRPLEPLTHVLLGTLREAGLIIAGANDQQAARAEVGATVERILEGLRTRGR